MIQSPIVVFAPHADDEVLGLGGTIARCSREGSEIYVIVVTNAHNGSPDEFSKEDMFKVRTECLASCEHLGVNEVLFLELPAPTLDAVPVAQIATEFCKLIAKYQPKSVFLPFGGDLHEDHKAVYKAGLVASRPHTDYAPEMVFCYETLSETEWGSKLGQMSFSPNLFVDISSTLEVKINAFSLYESQIKEFPHPRSLRAISSLARKRGAEANVEAAEAFFIERIRCGTKQI